MLELLAPAGSPEAVIAAVQNGANAVYLGFNEFNARRNAKNFTYEEFGEAAEYCRIRGVKVYATLNILATDREMTKIERLAKWANRIGVDAILVQDLGVLQTIKQTLPDMPVHISTQAGIHSLDGAKQVARLGASRVVLARELSKAHIAYICKNAPIEVEVFIHGSLCFCYSGQCYMSAVIGGRSANRGLCAQPCRLAFSADGSTWDNPLSLKDYCLAGHLRELEKCGVTCLKIEGRMKRPEYTAVVTRIYASALKSGRDPTEEEMRLLDAAFSREGFTDGYFEGKRGRHMLGVRTEENKREPSSFHRVRSEYLLRESKTVPVRFDVSVRRGQSATLSAEDGNGNRAQVTGPVSQPALNRELTRADLQAQLSKTGGTPYLCEKTAVSLDSELNLSFSEINKLRRSLLEKITKLRAVREAGREGVFTPPPKIENKTAPPRMTLFITRADQLTPDLMELGPGRVYIPMDVIVSQVKRVRPYLEKYADSIAVVLPRVILDDEYAKVREILKTIRKIGVTEALVGNLGHALLAQKEDFSVRGDFGLNVFNSQTLQIIKAYGFRSATLSFELNIPQIRDIAKCIDTELIVYGRLPLMVAENAIAGPQPEGEPPDAITDRTGAVFPVIKDGGNRTVLLNSKNLFLADRERDYLTAGLWGYRLLFTAETPMECLQIAQRYQNLGRYEPVSYTRGLYYRGVE